MSGPDSPSRITYPEAVTSALASSEARSFLASEGLAADPYLFDPVDPGDVTVEEHPTGRRFLFVGTFRDDERCGVDTASGAVVAVSDFGEHRVWHINASVVLFARSMEAFTERCPFCSVDDEREVAEQVAADFRAYLLEIDPTSLNEDPGYWNGLLDDIAIGDYSDEDD